MKRVSFSNTVETRKVTPTYKKSQFSKPNLNNVRPGAEERKKKRKAAVKKRLKELKRG